MYSLTIVRRLWAKIEVRGRRECWPWTGATDSHGYGEIKVDDGSPKRAHRVLWEVIKHKVLPSEIHVLHTCDNPPCCNHRHLYEGNHEANMADKVARGRTLKGWPAGTTLASISDGTARRRR